MTKVEHWMCDCPQWFAIPTTYSQCAWCKAKQKYYSGKEKTVRFHKIFRPNYEDYKPPTVTAKSLQVKIEFSEPKVYLPNIIPEPPQLCQICFGNLEKRRVQKGGKGWTCIKCKNSISRKKYYGYKNNRIRAKNGTGFTTTTGGDEGLASS